MASLTDESFEDREILLKMIFHPDQRIRMSLEPFLLKNRFEKASISGIVRRILQSISRLLIHAGDPHSGCYVALTEDLLQYYVSKVHIDRYHNNLAEGLKESLPEQTALQAGVLLRCNRHPLSDEAQIFLSNFIIKSRGKGIAFLPMFELVLSLLSHIPEKTNISDYFLEQQEAHLKMLEEIERFEKKKDHYSMEYLMMQRYRVPPESHEVVAARLSLLNTLVFDILELMPRVKQNIRQRDLGTFKPGDDIGKLIALLS